MSRLLRTAYITWIFFRFGLDELLRELDGAANVR